MTVVGIIAEYNPFHNGHAYQIEEAKKKTGADYAIVVMSGNYVQRGIPALFDKHLRANCAIYGGADLILELPVISATASGAFFAEGAVSLLEQTGICDYLCFGSESGNLDELSTIADLFYDESLLYKETLHEFLAKGYSFPQARRATTAALHGDSIASVLDFPNNILGIEYLLSLKRLHSSMRPITIKRVGNMYHDSNLTTDTFSSATAIRSMIASGQLSYCRSALSEQTYEFLTQKGHPVFEDDLSPFLLQTLLTISEQDDALSNITQFFDVETDLARRILSSAKNYYSYSNASEHLHTKNTTHTHVNRALLHILLGIKKEHTFLIQSPGYLRPLGFKKSSSILLRELKQKTTLPILSKYADASTLLSSSPSACLQFALEDHADRVYRQMQMLRYKKILPMEESIPICIL